MLTQLTEVSSPKIIFPEEMFPVRVPLSVIAPVLVLTVPTVVPAGILGPDTVIPWIIPRASPTFAVVKVMVLVPVEPLARVEITLSALGGMM